LNVADVFSPTPTPRKKEKETTPEKYQCGILPYG